MPRGFHKSNQERKHRDKSKDVRLQSLKSLANTIGIEKLKSKPDGVKSLHEYREEVLEGFYHSKEWRELRAKHIALNPYCTCGRKTSRMFVDHIEPVKLMPELRLEPSNLQTLCTFCHSKKTRGESDAQRRKDGIIIR